MILFFTNAEFASATVFDSINYCIETLIPALFPFLFLCNIFSCSSTVNIGICGIFKKLFSILGICKTYTSPIVFGNIGGFVGGAYEMTRLYNKKMSGTHFSDCVILCSNAGIGFVISFIGVGIMKNASYGIYLYFSQLILSFLLFYALSNPHKNEEYYEDKSKVNFIQAVVFSTNSAMKAMTTVCSFTVVFSLLSKMLIYTLGIDNDSIICATVSALLEVSQGISASSLLDNILLRSFFIGFSVGFGGLCVILQIFSVCSDYPLNRKKFLLFKLIEGILLGGASMLYFSSFSLDVKILFIILAASIILIVSTIVKKIKFRVDFLKN